VLDTVAGREGAAETFSGGERVLLGEAVSLALSMLACRRAGLVGVTLVRDETGAALDPANGRAYVAMLRRAAELVGARQVLFVSHSPELAELADARIVVGGGTAVVG
jgi:exonuclease SbcC